MNKIIELPCVLSLLLLTGCQSITEKTPSEALTPMPAVFAPKQLERKPSEQQVGIHVSFYKVELAGKDARRVDWGLVGKRSVTPSASSPIKGVISPYKGTTNQILRVDKSFADQSILDYLSKQGKAHLEHDSTVYVEDGKSAPFALEHSIGYLAPVQCTKMATALTPGVLTNIFSLTFQPNIIDKSEIWLSIKGNFSTTATEPAECGKKPSESADLSVSEGSFFASALALPGEEAIVISGLPDPTDKKQRKNEVNVIVLRMKVID
jgi:hypothetical protein